jgi:hypothetical protein
MSLKSRVARVLVASFTAGAVVAVATPAQATGTVTCGSRTDWFRLMRSGYVTVCLANSGTAAAYWTNTFQMSSGNNTGQAYTASGWNPKFLYTYSTYANITPLREVLVVAIN